MAIDITPALVASCPHMSSYNINVWSTAFRGPLERYKITSVHQLAAFIGQVVVESGGFTELVENMNYSAQGLRNTWPQRFPSLALAMQYARQPEKIGNFVYANRMGNGPPESGDGYLFRGRGALQTTGREAYTKLANAYGRTPADMASWMETPSGAAEAGCWDWINLDCGALADAWALTKLSIRINGGTIGLDDRIAMCNIALKALGASVPSNAVPEKIPVAVVGDQTSTSSDSLNQMQLSLLDTTQPNGG
jgi:putative chitinase